MAIPLALGGASDVISSFSIENYEVKMPITGEILIILHTCFLMKISQAHKPDMFYRAFAILSLTWLANKFGRLERVSAIEQLIMSYGG